MCDTYIRAFRNNGDISFAGMREVAVNDLRTNYSASDRDNLYDELKRGIGILDDDAHLNMYLWSFGKMHMAKMEEACAFIPKMFDISSEEIEIFDWGCGQGTATVCLLDYLYNGSLRNKIKSITLVEPSTAALNRAEAILKCFFQDEVAIRKVNKGFDDLSDDDITGGRHNKLHLFSNILDVAEFDLATFIQRIQRTIEGQNYFVCLGPYYYNNRRVDEFVEAISPDAIITSFNKPNGTWKGDWSFALRVFSKNVVDVDDIQEIRKRIDESKKVRQFFAGYILDEVSETLNSLDEQHNKIAKELLLSLSSFDVHSNKPFELPETIDSKCAVLHNLIVRGLPTIAPLALQERFVDAFGYSTKPDPDSPSIKYKSSNELKADDLYKALHIIDPRFNADNYNGDLLESQFERDFIESRLKGSANEYLIQLLEPQRKLSSIVSLPDRKFAQDQRVDFALEIPCHSDDTQNVGFIIEIDGAEYHSNIFKKLHDQRRDRVAAANAWETYRLDEITNYDFVDNWSHEQSHVSYLNIIRDNFTKVIEGDWAKTLQYTLSPLAIARVQKIIIEAIITGALNLSDSEWNIAIVERDVPCAKLAIENLEKSYRELCALDGTDCMWPKVKLDIFVSDEFASSPLHDKHTIKTQQHANGRYDVCIDISMLLRDNIDASPLALNADTFYIVRSSHYKKEERVIYTSKSISYLPLVTKSDNGAFIDIDTQKEHLTYFLQNIFRKRNFRQGQLPILSRALSNKTTIGLLPTGGGKSLTYQMASILQPGVTVVIDPLISLMVDQERGLNDIRIDSVACVNSTMDARKKNRNLYLLQNGCLQFILLSPERFMMDNFRDSIEVMSIKNNVFFAYGVIDEVHCVSEWGHDFRPAYLHLGRNMIRFMHTKSNTPVPVIGLTATASFDVLADVERELMLGGNLTLDSEAIVRPENDSRDELTYKIVEVTADFSTLADQNEPNLLNVPNERPLKEIVASEKKLKIQQLLANIPNDINRINERTEERLHTIPFDRTTFYLPNEQGKYDNAGIIFCPHAKGSFGVNDSVFVNTTHEGVATYFTARCAERVRVGTFVGGDRPSGDMKTFNENGLNLMVATKAFGMGIDKPNVRYTINFTHPSSIESFVQEAGRGGRDRKNAISYLLYEPTEYICLSVDKLNTLALDMGETTIRLWNLRNKYILAENLINVCLDNGYSQEDAQRVYKICVDREFFENVDKDIELWFHNNSFRGLLKEKVILLEMTDRILNVKPRNLNLIQNQLREQLGNDDVELKLRVDRNSIIVQSAEDPSNQYGYLFLDTLTPTFRYINFDEYTICRPILGQLISILRELPDYSAQWLNRPVNTSEENHDGIYAAMQGISHDGYIYVTVSWENQIQQDMDEFERRVKQEISSIAYQQQWNDIDEHRFGRLDLRKIGSFDELLSKISRSSNDPRWLQNINNNNNLYLKLKRSFFAKRDKDDTDKAIYRMCCIGLVEDVTIDYNLQTYQLKIVKRTDEEYLDCMYDFFRKYFSNEQAAQKVGEIKTYRGRNILDKCLGYLAEFVYLNLEKKRYRSIDDMRLACSNGIEYGEDWLKEFIHLYFNSKYARDDYRIGEDEYSLKMDTDRNREDFDVVRKYIHAISIDSSGSEIDNVKHLYGATLLVLRAHPENAALNILRTFCIVFLGIGNNKNLKQDAHHGYIDGFFRLFKATKVSKSNLIQFMSEYNEVLSRYAHDRDITSDTFESWSDIVLLNIDNDWLDDFNNKYSN